MQITLSMQLVSYVPHSKTDEKLDTASSFLHLVCPAPAVLLVQVNMEEIQELLGYLEAAHEQSEPPQNSAWQHPCVGSQGCCPAELLCSGAKAVAIRRQGWKVPKDVLAGPKWKDQRMSLLA